MEKFFYAGSFDPFTIGHLNITLRALEKYGRGIIGIAKNPQKKPTFDKDTRINMINECLAYIGKLEKKDFSDRIEIVCYDGLTIDAAIATGATVLVRGVRDSEDEAKEKTQEFINAKLCKIRGVDIRQETFHAPQHLRHVSSSAVKQLCQYGEYIAAKQFVTPPVHNLMMKTYLFPIFNKYIFYDWEIRMEKNKEQWKILERQFNRPYHNFSHIACMFNRLKIHGPKQVSRSFIIAMFYHDYDINSIEASWHKTRHYFPDGKTPKEIKELICATDHFGSGQKLERMTQLIHDLDLAELADEETYMSYAFAIRLENIEVPLKKYITKRINILKHLRDHLALPTLGEWFEKHAKTNLSSEIKFWEQIRHEGLPQNLIGLE